MGVNIHAFSKLKYARPRKRGEETPEGMVHVYHWSASRRSGDGMREGLYWIDGNWFSTGNWTCHGYGLWRADLARMTGTTAKLIWKSPGKYTDFVELINFPDNEGTIGPKTCAKLFQDFVDWRSRAEMFSDSLEDPKQFMEDYMLFHNMLALVGPRGAIVYR